MNNVLIPFRNSHNWTGIAADTIREDYKRIGDYYQAYYFASGRTIVTNDETQLKTHKMAKYPNGIPNHLQTSDRKIMRLPSIGDQTREERKTLSNIDKLY